MRTIGDLVPLIHDDDGNRPTTLALMIASAASSTSMNMPRLTYSDLILGE